MFLKLVSELHDLIRFGMVFQIERERKRDRHRDRKDKKRDRQREREERERETETERDPSGHLQWPYIRARSSLFTRGHCLDLRGKKVLGIYDDN